MQRQRAASWAVIAAVAGATVGCGGEPSAPAPRAPAARPLAATTGQTGAADGGIDGAIRAPLTLDLLAARGSSLARGMTEVMRAEAWGVRSVRRDVARAGDRDLCVRIAFAAGAVVHAWLEDATGTALADGGRAESGALGARGPVCVRRGDTVVLRVESDQPTDLRVVAFSAP